MKLSIDNEKGLEKSKIFQRKVICFGTFDVLHLGHLNYFQQAKEFGDYLIVVVARDCNLKKKVLFSEDERLELVKNIKIVDEAVLGNEEDFFKVIIEKQPAVVCLGYDHSIKEDELRTGLTKRGLQPEIKRMQSYQHEKYKSSVIKNGS
ncbi:MAG: adenylyltransferase/cytidyltransferase family protein [Nanoarchaeota archaeon]|nr:adenylyltransferase/cytidyltransferase family protein [Nanoarchaeota archaeon]MBU1623219.1 adenylyltransferase/cytidyltransferase family protein [Nanoarchaeota archaeon]MBU1974485.1 adenylyltransferase/cytidyltransferase family protein [Nanoarchaeota archaeon]